MKSLLRPLTGLSLSALLLSLPLRAAEPNPAALDLTPLAGHADQGEFVEVRLGKHLLTMAAQLVEPSQTEVAQIIRGLESVRVHVIGLNESNREAVREQFHAFRQSLDARDWERIVTVRQGQEDVCVQLKARDAETVDGILVTVVNADQEAVLVNIVGNIRPEQIGQVAEQLNIPPLKHLRRQLEKAQE